ncbi:MAG: EAL domain-containing protein, partial [Candidatus Sulfotelmatobacter sp.]
IEAAEDTGLLVATGYNMMREVCQQLQTWMKDAASLQTLSVNVNVSAKQLNDAHFFPTLEKTLLETGIDPSQLHLEMTASVAAGDPKPTAAIFAQLKKLGVGVTLEDFGTANTSLLRLRQSPALAALKIDRTLVTDMLLDLGSGDTVEAIILLAHKLKLKVIAEGIESAKQLERLHELGCELGQGYLFSPPVDVATATALLRQRSMATRVNVAGA